MQKKSYVPFKLINPSPQLSRESISTFPITEASKFRNHLLTLNTEQRVFLDFLQDWHSQKKPSRVLVVNGGPGTGKSYTVFQTLQFIPCALIKLAFTRKVAESIGGLTIHSALHINYRSNVAGSIEDVTIHMKKLEDELEGDQYKKQSRRMAEALSGTFRLNHLLPPDPDIVVIDEVGMIPTWLVESIIFFFTKAGKPLFILIGDQKQLKPVRCMYNIFEMMTHSLPTFQLTLTINNRFTPLYNVVIQELSQDLMDDDKRKRYIETHFPIRKKINDSDLPHIKLVLAYKNDTVARYNESFLSTIPNSHMIEIPVILNGRPTNRYPPLRLKAGCRMMTTADTKTKCSGSVCFFEAYNSAEDKVKLSDGTTLSRQASSGQFPLTLAYAVTIHKYQGQTLLEDGILFDFDESNNGHLIYTALSRVRSLDQIYGVIL